MIPNAIVVLAHLMKRDGTLGVETRARADKAAELSETHGKCPLVLMGWNYRDDTELCISDAMASYLQSAHGIEDTRFLIDRQSRDTVGDAILSKKKFLSSISSRHLAVVTSDYHVARTRHIFEFVYGPEATISVVGVPTQFESEQIQREEASLLAFSRTFDGVRSGDDDATFAALIRHHPFYNGSIYPIFQP